MEPSTGGLSLIASGEQDGRGHSRSESQDDNQQAAHSSSLRGLRRILTSSLAHIAPLGNDDHETDAEPARIRHASALVLAAAAIEARRGVYDVTRSPERDRRPRGHDTRGRR